jgi:hypothetical protein
MRPEITKCNRGCYHGGRIDFHRFSFSGFQRVLDQSSDLKSIRASGINDVPGLMRRLISSMDVRIPLERLLFGLPFWTFSSRLILGVSAKQD